MYYNIPEDKKKKIIYDFEYTRKRILKIAEDLDLSFEQVMWVLEQYNNKRKEEGKENITRGNSNDELDKTIYDLRSKGLSYEKISDEVGLCPQYVSKRCKIIYAVKGEEEPKAIYTPLRSMDNAEINNMIFRLRKQGKSFQEIGKMMPDKKRSRQEIQRRYATMIDKQNEKLAKEIIKLTTTRNATVDQLRIMADYYGVDLEESLKLIDNEKSL